MADSCCPLHTSAPCASNCPRHQQAASSSALIVACCRRHCCCIQPDTNSLSGALSLLIQHGHCQHVYDHVCIRWVHFALPHNLPQRLFMHSSPADVVSPFALHHTMQKLWLAAAPANHYGMLSRCTVHCDLYSWIDDRCPHAYQNRPLCHDACLWGDTCRFVNLLLIGSSRYVPKYATRYTCNRYTHATNMVELIFFRLRKCSLGEWHLSKQYWLSCSTCAPSCALRDSSGRCLLTCLLLQHSCPLTSCRACIFCTR